MSEHFRGFQFSQVCNTYRYSVSCEMWFMHSMCSKQLVCSSEIHSWDWFLMLVKPVERSRYMVHVLKCTTASFLHPALTHSLASVIPSSMTQWLVLLEHVSILVCFSCVCVSVCLSCSLCLCVCLQMQGRRIRWGCSSSAPAGSGVGTWPPPFRCLCPRRSPAIRMRSTMNTLCSAQSGLALVHTPVPQ